MSPQVLAGTGVLRGVVAGVLLVAFLALWVWAYSGRRRSTFEAAARLPFEDDRAASDRAVSEGTPSGGEGIPSGDDAFPGEAK
jgi:cytochrome c oxidase cbb3-type subunit 4